MYWEFLLKIKFMAYTLKNCMGKFTQNVWQFIVVFTKMFSSFTL